MADGLSDIGSNISARFQLVNSAPAATLVVFIWLVAGSGALSGSPSIANISRQFSVIDFGSAAIAVFTIYLLAVLANPFQTKMVKLLEGYWRPVGLRGRLMQLGLARHSARRFQLSIDQSTQYEPSRYRRLMAMAESGAAAIHLRHRWWSSDALAHYPPEPEEEPEFEAGDQLTLPDRLMPTRLGNALRAGEDRAGDRFGMDAVAMIPYLFGIAAHEQIDLVDDAQTQLDVSVKFVYVWLVATAVGLVAFFDDGPWLCVPLATFLLSWLSYEASILSASAYTQAIGRLVDLYRFDLLRQLHWRLPNRHEDEAQVHHALARILRGAPLSTDAATPFAHELGTSDRPSRGSRR